MLIPAIFIPCVYKANPQSLQTPGYLHILRPLIARSTLGSIIVTRHKQSSCLPAQHIACSSSHVHLGRYQLVSQSCSPIKLYLVCCVISIKVVTFLSVWSLHRNINYYWQLLTFASLFGQALALANKSFECALPADINGASKEWFTCIVMAEEILEVLHNNISVIVCLE